MILDVLSNAGLYSKMSPLFEKALRFLQDTDLRNLPSGRHPIDGDRVFALVEEYNTRPVDQCEYEVHRKYWDVQCVIRGAEQMGYAPLASMKTAKPYNPQTDLMFLNGDGVLLNVKEGMFAVFGLEDAHMPKVAVNGSTTVKKVVVKVAV
jgi:YhcH/YjgK/YiaL family protein